MPDRFTVYDVFAVLIPGVVFSVLLSVTIGTAYNLDLASLPGTLGDGALVLGVLVFGYAIGELLQATGKLVTSTVRHRLTGGMPATPRSLLPCDDPHAIDLWTQGFKDAALAALRARYGVAPPGPAETATYQHLTDLTLRAYKWVEGKDTLVSRHLAQQHQMRAFFVAFAFLALVASGSASHGAWFGGPTPAAPLFFLSILYGILAALAWWRMVEKDRTFAKHVLCRFLELTEEESRASQLLPSFDFPAGNVTIDATLTPDHRMPRERVTLPVAITGATANGVSRVHVTRLNGEQT